MNVNNNRAGCITRNLSCCFDDGIDDDTNDFDRKRRQTDESGYYCCDPKREALILGYDQATYYILVPLHAKKQ